MEFFKRSNSLDSIGVLYDDSNRDGVSPAAPEAPATASSGWPGAPAREGSEQLHVFTMSSSPIQQPQRRLLPIMSPLFADVLSDSSTTAETRTYSSSYPRTTSTLPVLHLRSVSGDWVYAGQPQAVVRFRSCINASDMTRNDAASGNVSGAASTADGEVAGAADGSGIPSLAGPFTADILCIILLYVGVDSHADIVQMGGVCRFWRYYVNLAPHWTYFRRKEWKKQADLPRYVRRAVAKIKIVTRDDYIKERQKVEDCKRREELISTAKHLRWCLATAIMTGIMITANFVVAYFLGFLRTALHSDVKLAITTFVLMVVMSALEFIVVVNPLASGPSSSSNKQGTLRILSWGLLMLVISMVLGTISALAFTRVRATGRVLDGSTIDFSMNASCTIYTASQLPSFAFLPAELSDIRWRPITTDASAATFEPYCLPIKEGDSDDGTRICFVLLYFDANYSSAVFSNATALELEKNVGTTTALGFDPLQAGPLIGSLWCQHSDRPQVIALTTVMYAVVMDWRDRLYPSTSDWLGPARRTPSFDNISFRCSSNIHRAVVEDPSKSTQVWYDGSVAWQWHYVPLLSDQESVRKSFEALHRHFLWYAFACHIIAAGLWVLMLLSQMIWRHGATELLGVSTVTALLLLNPLTMMLCGILCVHVSDQYMLCSATSGGALIGGGVGLLFLVVAIYVAARKW